MPALRPRMVSEIARAAWHMSEMQVAVLEQGEKATISWHECGETSLRNPSYNLFYYVP